MANAVYQAIAKVATNKLNGKYNLAQYKEGGSKYSEKCNAIIHKSVCEQIVAFMTENKDIPFYFVLQVGVAKGAYKMSAFEKGYKFFNAKKVKAVYEMGGLYYAHNGVADLKMSDVAIRLIMRYYEKVSSDIETFKADLAKSEPLGRKCGEREDKGLPYKILCKNLSIPYLDSEEAVKEAA